MVTTPINTTHCVAIAPNFDLLGCLIVVLRTPVEAKNAAFYDSTENSVPRSKHRGTPEERRFDMKNSKPYDAIFTGFDTPSKTSANFAQNRKLNSTQASVGVHVKL